MANPLANVKNTISGHKKLLGLLVGVAVIGGGLALRSSPEAPVPNSVVSSPMGGANPIEGSAENTPARNQALAASDAEAVSKARDGGGSVLPVVRPEQVSSPPVILPLDPPTPPAPDAENAATEIKQEPIVIAPPVVQPVSIVAPPTSVKSVEDKARTDAMMKYAATLVRPVPVAKVVEFGDNKDFIVKEEEQSAPSLTADNSSSDNSKVKLPLAGKILYAEIVGQANSDNPGPVIAKILQGDYRGATLVGSFKTTRDALVISFDKMTVETTPDGEEINETVAIKAVAVDTKDIGTGLASSVDRHMLSKLTIGFMSAFAQGFGDAISQNGSTSYNSSNGTYTTSTNNLDTKEELYSAGGKAIGKSGDILQQEFGNRPTTIIVKGGTPIGVLFL
jgi:intracellular multiplication protein IcmE